MAFFVYLVEYVCRTYCCVYETFVEYVRSVRFNQHTRRRLFVRASFNWKPLIVKFFNDIRSRPNDATVSDKKLNYQL